MICFNCANTKTTVTNSRTHKKTPQIWRRRYCSNCNKTFTTYERASLVDELGVEDSRGNITPYNPGILLIDLYDSIRSVDTKAAENAHWLTKSIEDDLIAPHKTTLTTLDIKQAAHSVLSRFNPIAGIQYAARHHLFEKIKRPRSRSSS